MRRIVLLLFLLPLASSAAWQLTWQDEFGGTGVPDASKWDRPEYNRRNNDNGPDGWWLREDSYLNGEGQLVIRVKEIANRNADDDSLDYSCGAVRTKGHFEQAFGRFECRCRLCTQPGWWVAFWLYAPGVGNVDQSGRDGTEIDIFEGFGWTDQINQALHWDGYGDDHRSTGQRTTVPGIREGYHDFVLEWYDDEYVFFVDGEETWRTDSGGVSQVPEYVKVTAEISTQSWAINEWWAMDPADAVYPDSFLVEYVRVYEYVATSTGPTVRPRAVRPAGEAQSWYDLRGRRVGQRNRGLAVQHAGGRLLLICDAAGETAH
jgi:beta-glucanase (GH16 family)